MLAHFQVLPGKVSQPFATIVDDVISCCSSACDLCSSEVTHDLQY